MAFSPQGIMVADIENPTDYELMAMKEANHESYPQLLSELQSEFAFLECILYSVHFKKWYVRFKGDESSREFKNFLLVIHALWNEQSGFSLNEGDENGNHSTKF